jgi:DNA-binding NarL/FixJ family response regulator
MTQSWKPKATAVLIDDHPGALMAACDIIKGEFDVVATAAAGDAGLDAVSTLHPDLVILDIGLPGQNGFETARRLKRSDCATRIVFLTVMEDADYAYAARAIGGSYVIKRRMHSDLLTAARDAMEGRLFFSPTLPSGSRLS